MNKSLYKKTKLEINKITLFKKPGHTDIIFLTIKNLPYPFPTNSNEKYLTIKFEVPKESGENYIKENFTHIPEIINLK